MAEGEHAHTGGGELDRARNSVEPSADLAPRPRVRFGQVEPRAQRPRPVREEADGLELEKLGDASSLPRGRKREGWNPPCPLFRMADRLAARREGADAPRPIEHVIDERAARLHQGL